MRFLKAFQLEEAFKKKRNHCSNLPLKETIKLVVETIEKHGGNIKKFNMKRSKGRVKQMSMDQFLEIDHSNQFGNILYLIQIRSKNGICDHMICVTRNLVFDSRFNMALILSRESLESLVGDSGMESFGAVLKIILNKK